MAYAYEIGINTQHYAGWNSQQYLSLSFHLSQQSDSFSEL